MYNMKLVQPYSLIIWYKTKSKIRRPNIYNKTQHKHLSHKPNQSSLTTSRKPQLVAKTKLTIDMTCNQTN